MNNKVFIDKIAYLFLLAIIVISLTTFFISQDNSTIPYAKNNSNSTYLINDSYDPPQGEENLDSLSDEVINGVIQNSNYCNSKGVFNSHDAETPSSHACFLWLFDLYEDARICAYLNTSQEIRDVCWNIFAHKQKNAEWCDYIVKDSPHYICFEWIATRTGNSSTCYGLSDLSLASKCIAVVTMNYSMCDQLNSSELLKYECYRDIAHETRNISLCQLSGEYYVQCKGDVECQIYADSGKKNETMSQRCLTTLYDPYADY